MKAHNKQTEKHLGHEITTRRASPKSPHYGYYHCLTCDRFVTWITRETYKHEKYHQRKQAVMWFGKYQGTPITELPDEYLEWAIMNVTTARPHEIRLLDNEYLRRHPEMADISAVSAPQA